MLPFTYVSTFQKFLAILGFSYHYVIWPGVAVLLLLIIILLSVVISRIRESRRSRGTYRPALNENGQTSRVEFSMILKPPPEERLIWWIKFKHMSDIISQFLSPPSIVIFSFFRFSYSTCFSCLSRWIVCTKHEVHVWCNVVFSSSSSICVQFLFIMRNNKFWKFNERRYLFFSSQVKR